MDDLNWEKVETIIDEVLQLPADQRKSYIGERCGNDKRTQEEVTTLLESIHESEGWLENPELYKEELFKELSADEILASPQSFIGTQIGSYVVRENIGEGGMGTVFLGERADDEFEHQVAIKIIRQGFTTEQNIQRFRREQKILAGMNHPGIARLFDGGVTDDGNPYIIMEFIDGTPITEYCQQRNCSIYEKLSLFTQVLEAVRHAHENLVIHRDLKPGNILVTDSGTVKILDFGISKLLEEDDSQAITKSGARLLTLKYAAPEQILQSNITTATDLYALGVMFYKLLVNQLPFDLHDKSRFESEQIILNEPPQKPSSKTTSHQLKKKLSGDLDAICLKSIRKEPDMRYRVANEFLEDLKNYSNGLPVTARDDTFKYRSQKFLRRHKSKVLVAGGFLILIIGFAVFYTWNITQERNLAKQEAERAEREQERAEEVTEFMVNLFQSNNPEESLGDDVPVRAVLEQGIERLENADLSLINQATILGTIAQIKIKLGDYETAEQLLNRAMIIVTDSLEIQNTNTASVATINGSFSTIIGNFETAERSFQIADSLFKKHSLTESSEYIDLKFNIVELSNENTDYEKSLEVLNELNPNQFGNDENSKILKTDYYNYKAIALKNLGQYEKAIENYLLAIELRRELFGPDNPETATAMNNLANVYVQTEQFEKALELSKQAHEIRNNVFGPDHYLTGSTLFTLSSISENLGFLEKALEYSKRSVRANKNSLGENHIRYALTLKNTSDILRLMNRHIEAKEYLDLASHIIEENYSDNDTFKGYVNLGHAKLYHDLQDFEIAEDYYSNTIDQLKNGRGNNHPNVGEALISYGKMEMQRKNYKKAFKLLNDARNNLTQNFEASDRRILSVDSLLAKIPEQISQ